MEASFEAVGMDGLVFGPRPAVLVSRCLLGIPCRYHGLEIVRGTGRHIGRPALIAKLRKKYELLDVCPEVDAGLPTPRPPIMLIQGRAICEGKDITVQLLRTACQIRDLARARNCVAAYLLKTSPTCDPTFGLCGKLLRDSGIKVVGV
jgi:uncharacterized protein YbbK (DUF523 family)